MKVKLRITKEPNYRKRFILRVITIAIIIFGLGFSADNLFNFSKGFFAYKTYASGNNTEELQDTADNYIGIDTITADSYSANSVSTNSASADSDSVKIQSENTKNSAINTDKAAELYPIRPKTGEVMGELYIPKLDATLPIYEGTNEDELDKGVGHFAESVLPGENDNSVLAGHRDTVFRKLGEIGEGDSLIVRTSAGEFKYKVKKVRIVDKSDRTVIVPKPSATLTVSTCYPFAYIGSAPKRYILVAYLASKKLKE